MSDHSYDELHEFARSLGKRRLGFQGDHYDIDTVDRDRAVDLGANPIDSRTLVRRLNEAGLRNRRAKPAWRRLDSWPAGERADELPQELGGRAFELGIDTTVAEVGLYADAVRHVLLCDLPGSILVPDGARRVATGPRADGSWSVELFDPGLGPA